MSVSFVLDFLSALVVAYIAYPVIRYIESRQTIYAIMAFVIFGWMVVLELRKFIIPKAILKWFTRPSNARNCNVINQGGFHGSAIGMPSGHMLITAYVASCIYLIDPTNLKLFSGIVMIVLMACARFYSHCHSLAQICIGTLVGIASAYLTKRAWMKTRTPV